MRRRVDVEARALAAALKRVDERTEALRAALAEADAARVPGDELAAMLLLARVPAGVVDVPGRK